jgi:hypothetical protein
LKGRGRIEIEKGDFLYKLIKKRGTIRVCWCIGICSDFYNGWVSYWVSFIRKYRWEGGEINKNEDK